MNDKDKLRELADQLICHPVSRSITEIEEAGEAIKCLLGELKSLQAENDRMAAELARPVSSEVSTLLAERARLIAENVALKKDAERYRYVMASKAGTIRLDGDYRDTDDMRTVAPQYIYWNQQKPLSAAIDVAMKGKP